MKIRFTAAAALAAALFLAAAPGGAQEAAVPDIPEAVASPVFLTDLAQELYWWYLDEVALDLRGGASFDFAIRRLAPALDEGDESEWVEIRVPAFSVGVVAKRPDYRIEETGEEVHGTRFRMVNVFRIEKGRSPTDGLAGGPWKTVRCGAGEMRRRIRERLAELRFPDAELTERFGIALCHQVALDPDAPVTCEQVFHIAPFSDVSNEVWAYAENQCWLVQFSTDREIEDPDAWTWEDLRVHIFDLRESTVATLGEMPGSNLAMTMDQAGRALFNCVVLGRRILVVDSDDPDDPLVRVHDYGDSEDHEF